MHRASLCTCLLFTTLFAGGCVDDVASADPAGGLCAGLVDAETACFETLTTLSASIGMTEVFTADHRSGADWSEVTDRWAGLSFDARAVSFEVICADAVEACDGARLDLSSPLDGSPIELRFEGWQWMPRAGVIEMAVSQVSGARYAIEVTLTDLVMDNPDPDDETRRVVIPSYRGRAEARFEYERIEQRDY